MKKTFKLLFAASITAFMLSGCQVYNYEERGSRNIEPYHNVATVPVIADVEIVSAEKITYSETFDNVELSKKRPQSDGSGSEIIEAHKHIALAHAIKKYKADFLIGAIFDVDYTLSDKRLVITITGFPAKYKNMRMATKEDEWIFQPQGLNIVK